jgi:hypothetical protein
LPSPELSQAYQLVTTPAMTESGFGAFLITFAYAISAIADFGYNRLPLISH